VFFRSQFSCSERRARTAAADIRACAGGRAQARIRASHAQGTRRADDLHRGGDVLARRLGERALLRRRVARELRRVRHRQQREILHDVAARAMRAAAPAVSAGGSKCGPWRRRARTSGGHYNRGTSP
jgi:hypothetical protein